MKLIVVTAMHGRNDTVKYCLQKSPKVNRLIVYSSDEDEMFLENVYAEKHRYANNPVSKKWNYAISKLSNIDFDVAIIMGSDDYFNDNLLNFVRENMQGDCIGFTDVYFESEGENYYFAGYNGVRTGEPVGAGRCYSKDFLKRINYNLFPENRDSGLDGAAWRQTIRNNGKVKTFSLRENNLMICDVKDGTGITKLSDIPRLCRL